MVSRRESWPTAAEAVCLLQTMGRIDGDVCSKRSKAPKGEGKRPMRGTNKYSREWALIKRLAQLKKRDDSADGLLCDAACLTLAKVEGWPAVEGDVPRGSREQEK